MCKLIVKYNIKIYVETITEHLLKFEIIYDAEDSRERILLMKKYEIFTDSCCDLPLEYIENKRIPYIKLTYNYSGMEFEDDFGKNDSNKKFYEDIKTGEIPKTSQPSSMAFYNMFKDITKEGKDIIYICVSSGLSGTLNSANIAKTMIEEEKSSSKIYIFDSLTASLGQGLLVMKAKEMQESGAAFEEIIDYLETSKQSLNTYMTVNDLKYLKKGGRISNAAATIGIMLHIKPLLMLNHLGKVLPVVKIKGRKKVIIRMADIVSERIENSAVQRIAICHGDCYKEAEKLKELILSKVQVKEVIMNYIGPVVGTFGGPGALAVFFMGKERQHHIIEK